MDSQSIKYSISTVKAQFDKDTVESTRKMTYIIAAESTGKNHRNRFLYNWSAWDIDSFNSNPIVGYQHNVYGDNMCLPPNPDDVIAKATVWMDTFEGKRALVSEAEFEPAEINPTAEKLFRKSLFGSLNSVSVGVLPTGKIETEYVKDSKGNVTDVFHNFPGQQLVEWSIVHIPADPNAMRRSLKSHTLSALSWVQRQLPNLSMQQIERMNVRDILKAIEDNGFNPAQLELGPDPELSLYKQRLTKIKK